MEMHKCKYADTVMNYENGRKIQFANNMEFGVRYADQNVSINYSASGNVQYIFSFMCMIRIYVDVRIRLALVKFHWLK